MRRFLPLLLLALPACDGSDLSGETPSSGALVVNQGNFSQGNGSLSTYDLRTGSPSPNAVVGFESTLQSALVSGGTLFVAADKAGRVDVFNAQTLQRDGAAITGLTSARYLAVSGTTLFVTSTAADFTTGMLHLIDLPSRKVRATVPLAAAPEGLAVVGDRVYVALHGFGAGKSVAVVHVPTARVTQTLSGVCDGPRTIVQDDDGDLNLVCTGTTTYDANYTVTGRTNGAVVVLDPATGAQKAKVAFDAQAGAAGYGQDAAYNPVSDHLYVVVGRTLRRFTTTSNVLQTTPVATFGQDVGAVGYDVSKKELYVALHPASPYTVAGSVEVHPIGSLGTPRVTFTAGIAPTFIAFR